MKLAKPQHEAFALFFETPTREKLRELIKQSIIKHYQGVSKLDMKYFFSLN